MRKRGSVRTASSTMTRRVSKSTGRQGSTRTHSSSRQIKRVDRHLHQMWVSNKLSIRDKQRPLKSTKRYRTEKTKMERRGYSHSIKSNNSRKLLRKRCQTWSNKNKRQLRKVVQMIKHLVIIWLIKYSKKSRLSLNQ